MQHGTADAMSLSENSSPDNCRRPSMPSTVAAEVLTLLGRWEQARRRRRAARTPDERADAEEERRRLEGEFWALENQLAELQMRMVRTAVEHQGEALRDLLLDLLEDELANIARAVGEEVQRGGE